MHFLSAGEQARNRRLLNLFMTTTAWTALLIYRVLYDTKGVVHGHRIREILEEKSGGLIVISNSVIYPLLDKMKKEGFVTRTWEERDDPNKRHRRFYRLTDAGVERFLRMRGETIHKIESLKKFVDSALTQTVPLLSKEDGEDIPLNISSFLAFWVLVTLDEPLYGYSLKRKLRERFPLWKISDGTLYPLLSELEQNGYIQSRWGWEEDEDQSRSVRIYQVCDKGREFRSAYGSRYREKLLCAQARCQFTYDFVYRN